MNGDQNGIGVLLGLVLGPVAYYFLAGALIGTAPWWGLVGALFFSLIGVAGAGTIVEGCVTAFFVLLIGVPLFAVGSGPPPLLGHGLLAFASGLFVGNLMGTIPFGLIGSGAAPESLEPPEDDEQDPRPEPQEDARQDPGP